LVGVQNLVKWGVCDIGNAIALATTAPRHAIDIPDRYVGQSANLLRWRVEGEQHLTWERLVICNTTGDRESGNVGILQISK
jgi:N-acetylglucosamine-6-phosphate deacetylase